MKIQFLGGAGTVTGSKYLLEFDKFKCLVDCGLFQGLKEWRLKNWSELPISPKNIDAVFLTHAHIDHSGYLPLLVKNGFTGPIYCSAASFDLCKILLPDSGFLHEEDARRANLYQYTKHHPALPLYTEEDANNCLSFFQVVDFNKNHHFFPNFTCSWHRAGHILGAAFIEIQNQRQHIVFSGDLGRPNDPIMKAPEIPQSCTTLILESTYGDREHIQEDSLSIIADLINETAAKNGSILIPAFAVGRTQAMLYYLDQLLQAKRIPNLPIYLDSPMAIDVTKILQKYSSEHRLSPELCQRICSRATYINSAEESKEIDHLEQSKIIISASGMLSGGRILHHLKYFGTDAKNSILLTGFQAQGTRGARLLNHETHLKIHGEMVPIRAKLVSLSSTSAHADYHEIIAWLKRFPIQAQKIFITHGEPHAALALQQRIKNNFGIKSIIPSYLQSFHLK